VAAGRHAPRLWAAALTAYRNDAHAEVKTAALRALKRVLRSAPAAAPRGAALDGVWRRLRDDVRTANKTESSAKLGALHSLMAQVAVAGAAAGGDTAVAREALAFADTTYVKRTLLLLLLYCSTATPAYCRCRHYSSSSYNYTTTKPTRPARSQVQAAGGGQVVRADQALRAGGDALRAEQVSRVAHPEGRARRARRGHLGDRHHVREEDATCGC